ncbi:MAG: sigma-70 family RNA polymerase sigma factor [Planctomycetes bacterium]|nr:sigma-70 family RNA polymerase sigma factor [Planctomycetota bacterium]
MTLSPDDATIADLLDGLNRGDLTAAESIFRLYEPYLRLVVRKKLSFKLRAKFDSVDVVQSVWADLLVGIRDQDRRFNNPDHLRAFLTKVTRHRFLDWLRQHRRALETELPLHESSRGANAVCPQPTPTENLQASDLWEKLLAICPPAHRDLLIWKRQGASLEELAAKTGLHPSSVRRILYDLCRRLALERQEAAPSEHAVSTFTRH